MQLHKSDAAAAIKRTFDRLPDLSVDHRLSFYHGSTLLHLAARRGRLRSIRLLLDSYHATLDLQDDGGFTPLCLAAWSGKTSAVRELLRRGADVTVAGTPPQSSWCGGRTAMTADVWAERKGFDDVVQLIRARGHSLS
jgi:ankyrin repeat protein